MIQLAELFTPAPEPAETTTRPVRGSLHAPPMRTLPTSVELQLAPVIPDDFVEVSALISPGLDRRLGYLRDARFVGLFYEPRGDEVIWNDGASYGFALGGWRYFSDEVERVARKHRCDLGLGATPATHMVLIDRRDHTAYLAERASALRFLANASD